MHHLSSSVIIMTIMVERSVVVVFLTGGTAVLP
jgi:hypothetical protein